MVQQFLAWAIRKNPLRHEKCILYIYIERERESEIPLVWIYTKVSVVYIFQDIYIYDHTNLWGKFIWTDIKFFQDNI